MANKQIPEITSVGCFKIGSKVFIGNGKVVREITSFGVDADGKVWARIKGGVARQVRYLVLAGVNGDGNTAS